MGYVKRVKQIYGNPSQKDKVLFRYDPAGQRAIRIGCICNPPSPITIQFNNPGTYMYTLPNWKAWNITYEVLGGGGGGGGGDTNIPGLFGVILYGPAGFKGFDSSVISSTFQTTSNTLTIIVGDGGSGGNIATIGSDGNPSSIADGIGNIFSSNGALGGLHGVGLRTTTYAISASVSGLPGTGGRGGNSDSPGSVGFAGYVKFTAVPVL